MIYCGLTLAILVHLSEVVSIVYDVFYLVEKHCEKMLGVTQLLEFADIFQGS